jgi:ABC-2 type transport system ATP-binding protein
MSSIRTSPRWTAPGGLARATLIIIGTGVILAAGSSVLVAAPAGATPPGIPTPAVARAELDGLTVTPEGASERYYRDLFPHWITISGACNTRETVLARDGESVVVNDFCAATAGSWYSPYDGQTWTRASDLDIDHIVPLAEAWRSGASTWTTSRRKGFANDLDRPQLIAVTDNVNQTKGDQDPSAWRPPLETYHCTYAKMWIHTKYHWDLTLQASEKIALRDMLATCGSEPERLLPLSPCPTGTSRWGTVRFRDDSGVSLDACCTVRADQWDGEHLMADQRLEIDRVSKRYGDVVALKDLTFDVRAGELFGLVGSNGAGKTTAMRVVLGVLAADAGEVRWAGQPLTPQVRRQIGYMPEERGLYPKMAVGEQLIYLARLHGMSQRAARASTLVWTERFGVAGRVNDEVQKLSLGNQQRVQLAASLVHDPRILVLDEPFSGLDPVAVDHMSAVLREKADLGIPVVFSSHQLDLVERLCDRVGIVRSGQMVAVGAVDELRSGNEARMSIVVPGAPPGWADGLPGVLRAEYHDEETVVVLTRGADDQVILSAALARGPVHRFAECRSSLTDLFRDVVSGSNEPRVNHG